MTIPIRRRIQRRLYCAKPSLQQTGGFTLPEAIAVVAIVGALMAIAAPGWLAFQNAQELSAAQDRVFQSMRQTQVEAIENSATWQTSVRDLNGLVQIAVHPSTALTTGLVWQSLDPDIRIDTRETTLATSGGVYRVQFNHKGQVNGQLGRITLSINNGSRTRRCVVVSTLLGSLRKSSNRPTPDQGGRYCY